MPELNSTPEFLSARLALLALRATTGQSAPPDADRVRIGSDSAILANDDAAQLLASKPKPLVCDAEASDGMLIVHCWSLADADPNEQQLFEARQRAEEKRGGVVPYVEEHYGAGDHLIAAFGRADSLRVPHSVVKRWSREYEIRGMRCIGDDVANPLLLDHSDYVEARQRGAKGVLRFLEWGAQAKYSSRRLRSIAKANFRCRERLRTTCSRWLALPTGSCK